MCNTCHQEIFTFFDYLILNLQYSVYEFTVCLKVTLYSFIPMHNCKHTCYVFLFFFWLFFFLSDMSLAYHKYQNPRYYCSQTGKRTISHVPMFTTKTAWLQSQYSIRKGEHFTDLVGYKTEFRHVCFMHCPGVIITKFTWNIDQSISKDTAQT